MEVAGVRTDGDAVKIRALLKEEAAFKTDMDRRCGKFPMKDFCVRLCYKVLDLGIRVIGPAGIDGVDGKFTAKKFNQGIEPVFDNVALGIKGGADFRFCCKKTFLEVQICFPRIDGGLYDTRNLPVHFHDPLGHENQELDEGLGLLDGKDRFDFIRSDWGLGEKEPRIGALIFCRKGLFHGFHKGQEPIRNMGRNPDDGTCFAGNGQTEDPASQACKLDEWLGGLQKASGKGGE